MVRKLALLYIVDHCGLDFWHNLAPNYGKINDKLSYLVGKMSTEESNEVSADAYGRQADDDNVKFAKKTRCISILFLDT